MNELLQESLFLPLGYLSLVLGGAGLVGSAIKAGPAFFQ